MGFQDEKLWTTLKIKAQEEQERCGERENSEKYLTVVADICQYGVDRAKTIRDTFPFSATFPLLIYTSFPSLS